MIERGLLRLFSLTNSQVAVRRPLLIAYLAILFVGGVLRYLGIDFAETVPWGRPDEETFQNNGIYLFAHFNPDVARVGWPELWPRVYYGVMWLEQQWWQLWYGEPIHMGCVFAFSPVKQLIPIRYLAATFSVATIYMVMRLARFVGPSRWGPLDRHALSLIAGLFYAGNVLAARDAHFAVTDQPLVFFLTWVFLAAANGIKYGRRIDFLMCGVALGFAISTKWTALSFGSIAFFALLGRFLTTGGTARNWTALALGGIGLVVTFLICNPTFPWHYQEYYDGLMANVVRYDPAGEGRFSWFVATPGVRGLERHATVSFPFAMGWPLTVLAFVGSFLCLASPLYRGGLITALCGFWNLFYWGAVVGRTTVYFARYSLPAHPTACIAAALVIVLLARLGAGIATRAIGSRASSSPEATRKQAMRAQVWGLSAAAVIAVVLAANPLARAAFYSFQMAHDDTREVATDWLREHTAGEPIQLLGYYSRTFAVDQRVIDQCREALPEDFDYELPLILEPRNDRVVIPTVTMDPVSWFPLTIAVMGETLHGVPSRSELRAKWVVATRAWLPCDQPVKQIRVFTPPARCYREVQHFEPVGVECDAMWDHQDHFWAPLWGFSPGTFDSPRLGPAITIYERTCDEDE